MCLQVQDGFLSIAMEANTSLVQTTLKEVRDAITEELFGLEWEDSNEVMMTKVTMTLQVRHAAFWPSDTSSVLKLRLSAC
jgi:hypothetical protein